MYLISSSLILNLKLFDWLHLHEILMQLFNFDCLKILAKGILPKWACELLLSEINIIKKYFGMTDETSSSYELLKM